MCTLALIEQRLRLQRHLRLHACPHPTLIQIALHLHHLTLTVGGRPEQSLHGDSIFQEYWKDDAAAAGDAAAERQRKKDGILRARPATPDDAATAPPPRARWDDRPPVAKIAEQRSEPSFDDAPLPAQRRRDADGDF